MKQLIGLFGCIMILLCPAGCQDSESLDVANARRQEFPQFLVGSWKADQHDWVIEFESDGSISRIVHMLWAMEIDVSKGGSFMELREPAKSATFVLGPCKADYDARKRRLSAEINLDMFHFDLGEGELKGKAQDFFEGPVSKDGRVWTTSWRHFAWLEGAVPPDPNPPGEELIFTRIDNGR